MSELQLRNNALSQSLTVTPALRLPDGTETILAPVVIQPQEVKSVDLDAAIAAANAPQLVGAFGSVVLRYRAPFAPVLYAAMMIHRTGHPIAVHIDATGESQQLQLGSREGVWWLPKDTTSGYLVLANHGKNSIPAVLSFYDASGHASNQAVTLGPSQTSRYSIRALVQAGGLAGSYGGIKISASTHAGSLNTLHFLFDETAEFSATLKMFNYDPAAELEQRDYAKTGVWTLRAPMLALSNPDPALAFPPGITLQPQLFLRNATGKPINASLSFNWRSGTTAGKAAGPALQLNPFETRMIDVSALQDGKTLPKQANWTSVTITTNSNPDELVAVASSYDATLAYGAQTPFSDQLTFEWEGGMWEYDTYHDSIITAGNGGTKATRAAFTIFYNQGTQRYDLEQTLQPDEEMWIDVGKLISQHVPDKNGKTLPADLTSGSYQFRDLTNRGVGTLFEGKVIYDKTNGHVAYGCAACCGWESPQFWYDPFDILLGGEGGQGVNAMDNCDLDWEDVSDSFYNNWSTGNTSIATVNAYGTHTGVGLGSTSSFTSGLLNDANQLQLCPIRTFTPSGPTNVPDVTPIITGLDPSDWAAGAATSVTVTGQYFGTNAPTLSFSPSSGISYSLSSYSDSQIVALVTVASGTPNEEVSVSVTNNGYGGNAFNGGSVGESPTSAPVYATVHSPINSPEITVIAWINGQAPDLATLPSGANINLINNLNNTPKSCATEVAEWSVFGVAVDINNSTDAAYANAWLLKNSANAAPPLTITPSVQQSQGDFRLFHDFGNGGGFYQVGVTPDPCGTGAPPSILNWLGLGQASQYMGASGTSPSGKVYQLAEGRIGKMGQRGSQTINGGRTVPWTWSVIEFDSSGNPTYSDVAIFPTYSVYVNGSRVAVYQQSTVAAFVALDQTYQRTPSQVQ